MSKRSDNQRSNSDNQRSNSDNVVNFDLNYLAENQPSMCIPRVFENISESQVRDVFEQLDLGQLDHIDIIERRSEKGEKYKRIFIHFTHWYWNDDACAARRRLIEGKDIKVVYNMPWFWKISANRWINNNNNNRESNAIHDDIRRNVRRGGPHIDFNDTENIDDRRERDDRRDDRRERNDRRERDDRRDDRRERDDRRDDRSLDRSHSSRRPQNNNNNNIRSQDRGPKQNNTNAVEVKPIAPIAPLMKLETSEAKAKTQEQMQLEIINSTKKRKIIVLKKKEPVKVEAVQTASVQTAAEKIEENV